MTTPEPQTADARSRSGRRLAFAEQELRLISALVLLIGLGLFLALPFVLSIGSVVFLPLTAAVVLTIILSPLADKLAIWGLPNVLASLVSLLVFLAIVILALALILQPAFALFEQLHHLRVDLALCRVLLRRSAALLLARHPAAPQPTRC